MRVFFWYNIIVDFCANAEIKGADGETAADGAAGNQL